MIFVIIGSGAALLFFICAGCAWYEGRSKTRLGAGWSASRRSGWSDSSHVLDASPHENFWDFTGGGDCGFCGGGDGGGDCGGGGDGGGD